MSTSEYVNSGPEGRERVVDLYYLNLGSYGMTYANFVANAERMMADVDLGLSTAEIDLRINETFQFHRSSLPPHEMGDRMVAMPFELLSGYIDTQLERREALELYTTMLARAKIAIRPVHTANCLTYESFGTLDCEHSGACPKISIGLEMAKLAMYGYDPFYEEVSGPMHDDYELGREKLQLAVRMGYMDKKRSGDIAAGYFRRHAEYMRSMDDRFWNFPSSDGS